MTNNIINRVKNRRSGGLGQSSRFCTLGNKKFPSAMGFNYKNASPGSLLSIRNTIIKRTTQVLCDNIKINEITYNNNNLDINNVYIENILNLKDNILNGIPSYKEIIKISKKNKNINTFDVDTEILDKILNYKLTEIQLDNLKTSILGTFFGTNVLDNYNSSDGIVNDIFVDNLLAYHMFILMIKRVDSYGFLASSSPPPGVNVIQNSATYQHFNDILSQYFVSSTADLNKNIQTSIQDILASFKSKDIADDINTSIKKSFNKIIPSDIDNDYIPHTIFSNDNTSSFAELFEKFKGLDICSISHSLMDIFEIDILWLLTTNTLINELKDSFDTTPPQQLSDVAYIETAIDKWATFMVSNQGSPGNKTNIVNEVNRIVDKLGTAIVNLTNSNTNDNATDLKDLLDEYKIKPPYNGEIYFITYAGIYVVASWLEARYRDSFGATIPVPNIYSVRNVLEPTETEYKISGSAQNPLDYLLDTEKDKKIFSQDPKVNGSMGWLYNRLMLDPGTNANPNTTDKDDFYDGLRVYFMCFIINNFWESSFTKEITLNSAYLNISFISKPLINGAFENKPGGGNTNANVSNIHLNSHTLVKLKEIGQYSIVLNVFKVNKLKFTVSKNLNTIMGNKRIIQKNNLLNFSLGGSMVNYEKTENIITTHKELTADQQDIDNIILEIS
jgi:hypothetical protein